MKSYGIFDGRTYPSKDLERASSSPIVRSPPVLSGGRLAIPMSQDGHYWIGGHINGHPVAFLVDTGARYSSVPLRDAAKYGLRAGVVGKVHTAGGVVPSYSTSGNVVHVGPFAVTAAVISLTEGLDSALLGQDVLNRFHTAFANGTMILSLPNQR